VTQQSGVNAQVFGYAPVLPPPATRHFLDDRANELLVVIELENGRRHALIQQSTLAHKVDNIDLSHKYP